MKAKYTIGILILGYCFDFIGAPMKILHLAAADTVFLIAAFLKVLGALLFFYKLAMYPKIKEFLNQ